jgi:hypothetical protein
VKIGILHVSLSKTPEEKQKQFATYIIQCDEDIMKNPDESYSVLEDIRSWALDLAQTFVDGEEEKKIRNEIKSEVN